MKFYIYKNASVLPTAITIKKKQFSVKTHCVMLDNNNFLENSSFNKFERVFEQKFGNTLNESQLTIDFDDKTPENSSFVIPNPTWDVTIQGDILRKLHNVGGYGSDFLKMELKIKFKTVIPTFSLGSPQLGLGRPQVNTGNPQHQNYVLKLAEFIPDGGEKTSALYHTKYRGKSAISSDFANKTDSYELSLTVNIPNYICTEDLLDVIPQTNQNILEEQKFCDFQITVDDDDKDSIPCHKIFLHAGSPVFARMLEGKFEEASQNKMKLEGISREGVHALLKFLYYSDLSDAVASPTVALELLKIADQYDMPVLWKAITTLLIMVEHGWFDIDTALNLFEFVRNRDFDEDKKPLMKRVIQVMALKLNQLPTSSLFMDIFSNPISRDMINLALETNKP